jgi:hypothetical protein
LNDRNDRNCDYHSCDFRCRIDDLDFDSGSDCDYDCDCDCDCDDDRGRDHEIGFDGETMTMTMTMTTSGDRQVSKKSESMLCPFSAVLRPLQQQLPQLQPLRVAIGWADYRSVRP